ncbi:hypothetical protein BDW66DRAFT_11004 [Aspergillus desertorum]
MWSLQLVMGGICSVFSDFPMISPTTFDLVAFIALNGIVNRYSYLRNRSMITLPYVFHPVSAFVF